MMTNSLMLSLRNYRLFTHFQQQKNMFNVLRTKSVILFYPVFKSKCIQCTENKWTGSAITVLLEETVFTLHCKLRLINESTMNEQSLAKKYTTMSQNIMTE